MLIPGIRDESQIDAQYPQMHFKDLKLFKNFDEYIEEADLVYVPVFSFFARWSRHVHEGYGINIDDDSNIVLLSAGIVPQPLGMRHPSFTPFVGFETQDGYVVLAIGNNELWAKFCNAVGQEQLINDERFKTNALRTEHYDELRPILANIIKKRSTSQWIADMEAVGVPCGPINTVDRVIEEPQIRAREMIVEVEHATAGTIQMAGVPIKLSATPGRVDSPAPDLGEHTDEVLSELPGLRHEEIEGLRAEKVI